MSVIQIPERIVHTPAITPAYQKIAQPDSRVERSRWLMSRKAAISIIALGLLGTLLACRSVTPTTTLPTAAATPVPITASIIAETPTVPEGFENGLLSVVVINFGREDAPPIQITYGDLRENVWYAYDPGFLEIASAVITAEMNDGFWHGDTIRLDDPYFEIPIVITLMIEIHDGRILFPRPSNPGNLLNQSNELAIDLVVHPYETYRASAEGLVDIGFDHEFLHLYQWYRLIVLLENKGLNHSEIAIAFNSYQRFLKSGKGMSIYPHESLPNWLEMRQMAEMGIRTEAGTYGESMFAFWKERFQASSAFPDFNSLAWKEWCDEMDRIYREIDRRY